MRDGGPALFLARRDDRFARREERRVDDFRRLLDARGDVDGFAEDREFEPRLVADDAAEHFAPMNADADAYGRIEAVLFIPPIDEIEQRATAGKRTLRVAFVLCRNAEQDERAVAQELVDDAAVLCGARASRAGGRPR